MTSPCPLQPSSVRVCAKKATFLYDILGIRGSGDVNFDL